MKNGLSMSQKQELRFINHLVGNVKEFDSSWYADLEQGYQKADVDIYQILKESREQAELSYQNYLDEKILNLSGVMKLGFENIDLSEGSVLGKITQKMRKEVSNPKEFRDQFLKPSLTKTTVSYDRMLRKAQRRHQREKSREGKSLLARRSFGWFR